MAQNAEELLKRRRNPLPIPAGPNAKSSNKLQECLREMGVRNPRDILHDVLTQKGERVRHTCEWILNQTKFSIWVAKEDAQLLRLIGPPGIGKTMMSTFLVEQLRQKVEKAPGQVLAYFFCDDKNKDRSEPTAILRSLIWQLLLQRDGLFPHIQSDFNLQGSSLCNDFSALWRIFEAMVTDEHAGIVFVIIDALDECESSQRKGLLQGMRKLFNPSTTARASRYKFLLTCRPEIRDIEDELSRVGNSLRMDSADINNDLSEYIDVKVDCLADRKSYTEEEKEMVRNALKRGVGGTFLWVSLMIDDLEEVLRHNVEETLKSLPHGLDATYIKILNRIPDNNRNTARFVLRCMVAARRPLRKIEIQTAFATSKLGFALPRQSLAVYDDICSACSSILYIRDESSEDDATITFCHQSVKDFLLHDVSSSDRKWYHASRDPKSLVTVL